MKDRREQRTVSWWSAQTAKEETLAPVKKKECLETPKMNSQGKDLPQESLTKALRVFFAFIDSDTRIPHARVRHCAGSPVRTKQGSAAFQTGTAKTEAGA